MEPASVETNFHGPSGSPTEEGLWNGLWNRELPISLAQGVQRNVFLCNQILEAQCPQNIVENVARKTIHHIKVDILFQHHVRPQEGYGVPLEHAFRGSRWSLAGVHLI